MTIQSGALSALPPPTPTSTEAVPLDPAARDTSDRAAGAGKPPATAHAHRPTPLLLARLGVPTPSAAHIAVPTGDSPVARALRLTTERTPLDRVLAGERPAEPERGTVGRLLRVLVDPGLWLPSTYAEVAQRLAERHPQVWLALAGSRPPRGSLTLAQRVATRRFVEGSGKARIAVLAGDADLQALVRRARLHRRLFTLLVLAAAAAGVAALLR